MILKRSRFLQVALLVGTSISFGQVAPVTAWTNAGVDFSALRRADAGVVFQQVLDLARSPSVEARQRALFAWGYQLAKQSHRLGIQDRFTIAAVAQGAIASADESEIQAGLLVLARLDEWKSVTQPCSVLRTNENPLVRALALWVSCLSGGHELGRPLVSNVRQWSGSPEHNQLVGTYLSNALDTWAKRCDDDTEVLTVIKAVIEDGDAPQEFKEKAFRAAFHRGPIPGLVQLVAHLAGQESVPPHIRELAADTLRSIRESARPGSPEAPNSDVPVTERPKPAAGP